MVMTDDKSLRQNRLALLSELRALFLNIADVSRLTPGQE
jgi:glycyl-tRNA synthetase beta chain